MKNLFILLSLFISFTSKATNYYVSSSSGNDAVTNSKNTPWKTIARTYQVALQPGDSVLLLGGDVFNECLYLKNSGTSNNHVVIASYGTGQAVISGAYQLIGGTLISGNVYEFYCPNVVQQTNLLTLDGILAAFGR